MSIAERLSAVMAGLVPAIHAFLCCGKDVDARHKAAHDDRAFGEDLMQ